MTSLSRTGADAYMRIMRAKASKAHYVYMLPHPWSGDLLAYKRDNAELSRLREYTLLHLPQHVDVFDVWNMTHARHDEACDGSHFMCLSRPRTGQNGAPAGHPADRSPRLGRGQVAPVGLWEGYTLAHAHGGHGNV